MPELFANLAPRSGISMTTCSELESTFTKFDQTYFYDDSQNKFAFDDNLDEDAVLEQLDLSVRIAHEQHPPSVEPASGPEDATHFQEEVA